MGKTIKILSWIFAVMVLFTLAVAANYDWFYNAYTGKQDRSLSLNQTGFNITADNFFGNISATYIKNEHWVDISGDNMTGNLNMSSNNVTTVDCVFFKSGGKICDAVLD